MTNVNSVFVFQPDKTAEVVMSVMVEGVKSSTAHSRDNTPGVTDFSSVLQWQWNQKRGKKRKDRELYYHLDPLIVSLAHD